MGGARRGRSVSFVSGGYGRDRGRCPRAAQRGPGGSRLRSETSSSSPRDLRSQAAIVALEHAAKLAAGRQRDEEVPGRVRGVEGHAAREDDPERDVLEVRVPRPEVHRKPVREAERGTEEREG